MPKYRISAISYLNTKPLLYGLFQSDYIMKHSKLLLDHPAETGEKLKNGQADIGLIPVAYLPQIPRARIISETCIATNRYMPSVLLSSQVPLQKIEKGWLDYQSASSGALAKILAGRYWNVHIDWLKSEEGYEKKIKGQTAGIIIGDRALKLAHRFTYNYDLSAEWYQFTGLPFVFACWVAVSDIENEYLNKFEEALMTGLEHLDIVIRQEEKNHFFPNINVEEYLKTYLKFFLDPAKKSGMKKFLSYL